MGRFLTRFFGEVYDVGMSLYWLYQIFLMFKEDEIELKKSKEDPRLWQAEILSLLATECFARLYEFGLQNWFVVVIWPEVNPCMVSIFFLDPRGELIPRYDERGFEVFRIRVEYPNQFLMTIFSVDRTKSCGGSFCHSLEEVESYLPKILINVLARHALVKAGW